MTIAGGLIFSFERPALDATPVLAPFEVTRVAAAEPEPPPPPLDYAHVRPFLEKYCLDCHTGESAEGKLDLAGYADVDAVRGDRRRWERLFDRVRVSAMPPSEADQPTDQERAQVVAWLERALFHVDCGSVIDPGRVTIRRLNRAEYNNTIRDLLGVDLSPADGFPSDDVGYGFDNIGDVLSLPPLLIEKYLDAADRMAAAAIVAPEVHRATRRVGAEDLRSRGAVEDGLDGSRALISQGSVSARLPFPVGGEYVVQVEAAARQAGDEPARMEIKSGDDVLTVIDVTGNLAPKLYEFRFQSPPGERRISVSFLNDFYNKETGEDRNLYVSSITVDGPFTLSDELPETHRRLLSVLPRNGVSVAEAATRNLRPLLLRAFRRPPEPSEVDRFAGIVMTAAERGLSFERGMQFALQAVLVSPHFLFRVETDKRDDAPDARQSLNDYELASRLSYFLWSSMPDQELFDLAAAETLQQDEVLARQARRMLDDPRSNALIENWGSQWLNLRKLETADVAPDPDLFTEFNDALKRDMQRETKLFLESVVRADRPLVDLLRAPYTFVNGRLAKLYGIDGIEGDEFRRVELAGTGRAGLITQASILTLTSYPTRTSPVKRGQWVLENILGDKPPDPPPVVPGLEESQKANPDLTLRQQLELHRSDPTCASCHQLMDDIGFGLENFDAIGRWRDDDQGKAIDTAGTLPWGEDFSGPAELTDSLARREHEFHRCLAEKLLTYAVGRGLEYYDRCAIDRIVADTEEQGSRFSGLVTAIVRSEPFRLRRSEPVAE